MNKLREWLNRNTIFVVVGIMMLSVTGNVVSSTFNSASLNNLTHSVQDIQEIQGDVSSGQLRTSCRTAVQADYDNALARLLMGSIIANPKYADAIASLPPDQAENLRLYVINASSILDFAQSAQELQLLADGKICVGDDPVRANGEKPGTSHLDEVDGKN